MRWRGKEGLSPLDGTKPSPVVWDLVGMRAAASVPQSGSLMTFGYLGYIWAIIGCSIFGVVFLGSAAFLYAVSRRGRADGSEPVHSVEELPVRPPSSGPPRDAA